MVCRALHVRFLWIDALCIIQKDKDEQDWYTESGKMRHIYSNAKFVIAADDSTNCQEGFLRGKYIKPVWRAFSWAPEGAKPQTVFFRACQSIQHYPNALVLSALSKRGWALQESILPSRILHFTAQEIVWECNTHCQCQCSGEESQDSDYFLVKNLCQGISTFRPPRPIGLYDDDNPSKDLLNLLSSPTLASVYWSWQTIIEYYTKRQLTNHADKLSALSGLAQVAIESHGLNEGAYLAGLWRGSLAKGLLWHATGPEEPRRYTVYCAPSWSWASIDGSIKYFAEDYQFQFTQNFTILEAFCERSTPDITGRVKGGYIVSKGTLVSVKLMVKHHSEDTSMYTGYNGNASHTHRHQMAYIQRDNKDIYEVLLDESTKSGEWDTDYYCLKIGTHSDPGRRGGRVWWLVLERRGVEKDNIYLFARVGVGYKYTASSTLNLGLFSHGSNQVIKLV